MAVASLKPACSPACYLSIYHIAPPSSSPQHPCTADVADQDLSIYLATPPFPCTADVADQDDGWWHAGSTLAPPASPAGSTLGRSEVVGTGRSPPPLPRANPHSRKSARSVVRSASAPADVRNRLNSNVPSGSLQHQAHDDSESEPGSAPFVYQDPVLYEMVAQKMATIVEADEAEYSASQALLETHAAAQAESLLVDAEAAAVPMRKDVVAQKLSEKLGRAPDAAEIQAYIASQWSPPRRSDLLSARDHC